MLGSQSSHKTDFFLHVDVNFLHDHVTKLTWSVTYILSTCANIPDLQNGRGCWWNLQKRTTPPWLVLEVGEARVWNPKCRGVYLSLMILVLVNMPRLKLRHWNGMEGTFEMSLRTSLNVEGTQFDFRVDASVAWGWVGPVQGWQFVQQWSWGWWW